MEQKSKSPGLRWRRPASMPALIGAVVVGVLMIFANITAIAAHDWRWFVVSGLAFLVFLGLVAYGFAAHNSRERGERRRVARRTGAAVADPPADSTSTGGQSDAR